MERLSWLQCTVVLWNFLPHYRLSTSRLAIGTAIYRSPLSEMSQKGVSGPPGPECQKSVDKVPKHPKNWNCLQWGRSNLVDPAGWPKIGLLNWILGSSLWVFPRQKAKLNFLQSRPRKFTKLIFSGLAPIQWVRKKVKKVFGDFFETFLTLQAGRRKTFLILFRDFGLRGPRDSCIWGLPS